MPKYSYFYFFVTLLFTSFVYSQKKTLQAIRIDSKIIIDGKFDETAWQNAPVAKNFVEIFPDNGKPIPENKDTEVKIVSTDEAVYVAALLHDDDP
ncbi:MAG: hydrolase, partial [Flavobacterium sp.]